MLRVPREAEDARPRPLRPRVRVRGLRQGQDHGHGRPVPDVPHAVRSDPAGVRVTDRFESLCGRLLFAGGTFDLIFDLII